MTGTEQPTLQKTEDLLIDRINALINPSGYEAVAIEILSNRQKILRIFIDFFDPSASARQTQTIGIEDCATVSRIIDEPLDHLPEVEKLFHGGAYELEVSSPGIERPLRQPKDFERFCGQEARIHVYRPLNLEEIGNPHYLARNPKQKNFLGTLLGIQNGRVRLGISPDGGHLKSSGKKKKAAKNADADNTNPTEEVQIPLPLISKANLEPSFEGLEEFEKSKR